MAVLEGTEVSPQRRAAGCRALAMGCAAVVVLAGVCVTGYHYWANHLPPPEPEIVSLPSPNGFDACSAAAMLLPGANRNSALGNPNTASPAALKAALAPNRAALDNLRQAMRLPYLTPPIRDPATMFPYLASYREACREFAAESRVALADGHPDEAIQRALDAVELGTLAERGGVMIHGLVGVACIAIGQRQAEQCVGTLSAAGAHAAGKRLDAILAKSSTCAEVLEQERRQSLSFLRHLLSGRASAKDLLGPDSGLPAPFNGALGGVAYSFYPKPWTYKALDAYYKDLIRDSDKPFSTRPQPPRPTEVFTQMLAPVMAGYGFTAARSETQLRLLRLELALREYRALHGQEAGSLAQLVPAHLTAVPLDPMTGKSFAYKPQAQGYLLYSLGPDGKDDGGKLINNRNLNERASGDMVAGTASWVRK